MQTGSNRGVRHVGSHLNDRKPAAVARAGEAVGPRKGSRTAQMVGMLQRRNGANSCPNCKVTAALAYTPSRRLRSERGPNVAQRWPTLSFAAATPPTSLQGQAKPFRSGRPARISASLSAILLAGQYELL